MKEDSWDFQQFYTMTGITADVFRSLRKHHTMLEIGYQFSKDVLGERRQRKATFKSYDTNPGVITSTLHNYHPDWKDRYKDELASRLKQDEDAKRPITVVVEK